jgi:hypothetical protein
MLVRAQRLVNAVTRPAAAPQPTLLGDLCAFAGRLNPAEKREFSRVIVQQLRALNTAFFLGNAAMEDEARLCEDLLEDRLYLFSGLTAGVGLGRQAQLSAVVSPWSGKMMGSVA